MDNKTKVSIRNYLLEQGYENVRISTDCDSTVYAIRPHGLNLRGGHVDSIRKSHDSVSFNSRNLLAEMNAHI